MPRLALLALCFFAPLSLAQEKKPGLDRSNQLLERFDYTRANLENATFERSNVSFGTFANANCNGANFRRAKLIGVSFNGTKLVGADFRGAKLTNAGFSGDLTGVNFEGTKCPCSFQGAILQKANLKGVSGFVDVTRVDFSGAEIQGADFSEAKDYGPNSADFTGAIYDSNTKFPPGVDKKTCGAKAAKEDWKPMAETQPDQKPEPKPEPKQEPKPEPKPTPKSEPKPADAGKGGELTYGKASLGYTKEAGAEAAKKLGDFLAKEVAFGDSNLKVQLDKAGETWILRILADKDLRGSADYEAACRELAGLIAKSVWPNSKVELHICDETWKTLKIVAPK